MSDRTTPCAQSTCEGCQETDCTTRRPQPTGLEPIERLNRIRHKVLVLSGKGGVGKSTVAVHLALALQRAGWRVGLLDVDIHGPSVPTMLNLKRGAARSDGESIYPAEAEGGLRAMSIGFLLQSPDDALIWRGPMKMSVIRQFLEDVEWGDLDALVVDLPPGTGDEPLSLAQLVPDADGAVIVTTPQEVALADVRKSVNFCRSLNLAVLGVVENMSGFVCPHCNETTDIFGRGGGRAMAESMGVPFVGAMPLDARMVAAGDSGRPPAHDELHPDIRRTVESMRDRVMALDETVERTDVPAGVSPAVGADVSSAPRDNNPARRTAPPAGGTPAGTAGETPAVRTNTERNKETPMRIAIPLAEGRLAMHFGHCAEFALIDVDTESKTITNEPADVPPPHEPGVLPKWLHDKGADIIIAGGMGSRAQKLFCDNGIQVIVGAPSAPARELVTAWMDGTLQTGDNVCQH